MREKLPDLSQTAVLVTGASGQIGRGIALQFARAGADVIAHHHTGSTDSLLSLIISEGGRAISVQGDLTVECDSIMAAAVSWAGRLDAVVNSAGIQPVQQLPGMTAEQWRTVVDTNLTSAFHCTQAAAAVLRGGSITHIASIEGTQPAIGHGHYNAAKAALIMHARSAALEYGPNIRVNTVSPGLIDRPDLAAEWPAGVSRWQAAAPLRRLGTPADVGNACVFLASPMASWITGHDLVVDGGVSAHPTW